MAAFMLLAVSCIDKSRPDTTPWGTSVAMGNDGEASLNRDSLLGEIMDSGELIVLTITGPDTYYDYRGHGLGVQYMMCESFAATLGCVTRVEVCKDTTELVDKLRRGYGDVAALQLHKGNKGVRYCGAYDSKRHTQWAVSESNKALADSLNGWFKADMPKKTLEREDWLLAHAVIHSAAYMNNPISFSAGSSSYTSLLQRYAPSAGLPWQLLAAQCYQESGFDAQARSWAGACGLMQLMPSTAAMLGLSREEIFNPEKNIAAGARLMGMLLRDFSDIPSRSERISFALAAYNAGSGHVRDAMALARKYGQNDRQWALVAPYVLRLSEPQYYQDPVVRHGYMRGSETVDYVSRIHGRYSY